MAAESDETSEKKRRGLMLPLIIGVVLALVGGGGGYWAVTMGPFAPEAPATGDAEAEAEEPESPGPDVVFLPLEPVVISLGPEVRGRHLMFAAHLEVPPRYEEEVAHLLPRVIDVLNSYLRVISLEEISEPTSLAIIRAQILRRIQVVTGPGRVQDLLVTQFVVN
ncbi:MAG: flagellar basal body-associated FliL family protein [Pseudomonadota bacterium]